MVVSSVKGLGQFCSRRQSSRAAEQGLVDDGRIEGTDRIALVHVGSHLFIRAGDRVNAGQVLLNGDGVGRGDAVEFINAFSGGDDEIGAVGGGKGVGAVQWGDTVVAIVISE